MRQVVDSVCELVRNTTCSLGWFHEWLAGDSSLWYTLPRVNVKKAVPVSDRVLRSQVANKFVAKHKFRGLTVTPLNGLDFD